MTHHFRPCLAAHMVIRLSLCGLVTGCGTLRSLPDPPGSKAPAPYFAQPRMDTAPLPPDPRMDSAPYPAPSRAPRDEEVEDAEGDEDEFGGTILRPLYPKKRRSRG